MKILHTVSNDPGLKQSSSLQSDKENFHQLGLNAKEPFIVVGVALLIMGWWEMSCMPFVLLQSCSTNGIILAVELQKVCWHHHLPKQILSRGEDSNTVLVTNPSPLLSTATSSQHRSTTHASNDISMCLTKKCAYILIVKREGEREREEETTETTQKPPTF